MHLWTGSPGHPRGNDVAKSTNYKKTGIIYFQRSTTNLPKQSLGTNQTIVQTKRGPRIHQRPPFIKQISPAISGLSLIAYRMSQRHLNNFIRKICPLRRPVSKRRSKAVNRYIESHPLQHHRDRGLREGLTASELKQEILT